MESARNKLAAVMALLVLGFAVPAQAAPPPAGWGTAQLVETDNSGDAGDPQLAFDAAGNAFAIWWQFDGSQDSIFSSRSTPGSGWGVPTRIETDNNGDAAAPQIAVNSGGNGFAVWYQDDGSRDSIFANRFLAGSGWGVAALLETNNSGNARNPQVAIGPNGTAIAVWYQTVVLRDDIYANRYDPSSGWGNATLLETNDSGNAREPQVAIAPDGTAFAIWYQFVDARQSIYANRYDPVSGWGNATLLENDSTGDARNPQIAVAQNGTAFAVWYQTVGADNIYSNRYDPASGWGVPRLLEVATGNARNPQVALGPNGTAVAIWYQNDGSRDSVYASQFAAGSGWGNPSILETDNAGNARGPQVATNGAGTTFATWYQSDGTRNNIWATRAAPGAPWGVPTLLEIDNSGNAVDPQVGVDSLDGAVVVWSQEDGFRDSIWADRYTAADLTPLSLTISAPLEGASTAQPSIWVAGNTEPDARVTVNGVLASVAPNGSFAVMVSLSVGSNRITVSATDPWGNEAYAAINVTANDPIAGLRQQLDDALAALNASQASLAAADAQLASAEANLSVATADAQALQMALLAAQNSLAAAQADLASTTANLSVVEAAIRQIQDDIGIADGAVNASAARVAALEADQNASQTDLDAARAQLAADQARLASLEQDLAGAQSGAAATRAQLAELQTIADAHAARLAEFNSSLEDRRTQNDAAASGAAQAGSAAFAGMVLGIIGIVVGALGLLVGLRRSRAPEPEDPWAPDPDYPINVK